MKYLSLDIETTGLNPEKDQVLHIAAVLEDTESDVPVDELPYWEGLIKHNRVEGDHYAIAMNIEIIETLKRVNSEWEVDYKDRGRVGVYNDTECAVYSLLNDDIFKEASNGGTTRPTLAGKNLAMFDLKFLDPHGLVGRYKHRVLDAGMLAMGARPGWFMRDPTPPSLGDLLIGDVTHDALEDARDVIRIIRQVQLLGKQVPIGQRPWPLVER
jgi:hypothetical protein